MLPITNLLIDINVVCNVKFLCWINWFIPFTVPAGPPDLILILFGDLVMLEEKLKKAHEILNKAVAMLLKEDRVNSFVDGEIFPLPDHVNDEEVLNELLDIQMKITNLQYKVSNLPVAWW